MKAYGGVEVSAITAGVHYATSRKVEGSRPDELIGFFHLSNFSSRHMALGPTQPLTEMSTRYFLRGGGEPMLKDGNHTAICESIVY
jgi:hypothetical protein